MKKIPLTKIFYLRVYGPFCRWVFSNRFLFGKFCCSYILWSVKFRNFPWKFICTVWNKKRKSDYKFHFIEECTLSRSKMTSLDVSLFANKKKYSFCFFRLTIFSVVLLFSWKKIMIIKTIF